MTDAIVPTRVSRLVTTALLEALHPTGGPRQLASVLARLAGDHPEALDRAVGQILRREQGRPTSLTVAATASLRLARTHVREQARERSARAVSAREESAP